MLLSLSQREKLILNNMFFEYFVEKYLDMDISFEDKFCKHFVTLRKCFEVFVSFNINHCLSKRTD